MGGIVGEGLSRSGAAARIDRAAAVRGLGGRGARSSLLSPSVDEPFQPRPKGADLSVEGFGDPSSLLWIGGEFRTPPHAKRNRPGARCGLLRRQNDVAQRGIDCARPFERGVALLASRHRDRALQISIGPARDGPGTSTCATTAPKTGGSRSVAHQDWVSLAGEVVIGGFRLASGCDTQLGPERP
jgi:hypothetical protein